MRRTPDVQFDVGRKLSCVAHGTQVIGSVNSCPTHHGEDRPRTHSFIGSPREFEKAAIGVNLSTLPFLVRTTHPRPMPGKEDRRTIDVYKLSCSGILQGPASALMVSIR